MVYINKKLKALFLHNPKCGGVYVRELLGEYYGFFHLSENIHENYEDFFDNSSYIKQNEDMDKHTIRKKGKYRYFYSHQDVDKKIFDDYFTFTFIRNPYDRIYSAYAYLKKKLGETPDGNKIRESYENPEYFINFKTFIKNMNNINNISYFHSFITQYDQLVDNENKINFNFIGRTEQLELDFIKILLTLDCDMKIRHTELLDKKIRYNDSVEIGVDISKEFDIETLEFINRYFKIDFDTFGYNICTTMNELTTYYAEKHNTDKQNKDSILSSLYSDMNNIKYNICKKEKTIKKITNIIDVLLNMVIEEPNKYIIKNEIHELTSELNDIRKENTLLIQKYKDKIESSILVIKKLIRSEIHSRINYCEKCNFKSYNLDSSEIHKKLCT